jgi:hypothetical protein
LLDVDFSGAEERRGDKETRRQGDKETGTGDFFGLLVSPSPCLLVC